MIGNSGAPGRFPLTHFAAELRGDDPSGPDVLAAVRGKIVGGRTTEITRIN